MLTYLRLLWCAMQLGYRQAKATHAYTQALKAEREGPGLRKCEPPGFTDDVCGLHCGVLECTCQNPLAHPVLWRDPGCPVHSRAGEAN